MVQVLKSAENFELFGGFKPWHRQGEHLKIQKPKQAFLGSKSGVATCR
jgi:hypothetical protein